MTGASVSMNGPPSICGLSRLGVLRASLQLHRLRQKTSGSAVPGPDLIMR
jgi:hypothetical protein